MGFLSSFGRKQMEVVTRWASSSGIFFGATGGILVTYMTEWKAVLQYVPYYNGKYPKEE